HRNSCFGGIGVLLPFGGRRGSSYAGRDDSGYQSRAIVGVTSPLHSLTSASGNSASISAGSGRGKQSGAACAAPLPSHKQRARAPALHNPYVPSLQPARYSS